LIKEHWKDVKIKKSKNAATFISNAVKIILIDIFNISAIVLFNIYKA